MYTAASFTCCGIPAERYVTLILTPETELELELSLFLWAGSDSIRASLLSRKRWSVGPLCHELSWLSGADCASSICTVIRRLGNLSASDRAIDVDFALTCHIWSVNCHKQVNTRINNSPRLCMHCQGWTSSVSILHPTSPPPGASPLHGADKRPTDGAVWSAPGGPIGTGAGRLLQHRRGSVRCPNVALLLASAGPPVRPTRPRRRWRRGATEL